ncbi:hypothetical protein I7I50_11132 [Histoplasma capsulatum G186AR]|uniref:Uncharacterized protein n=1 Tax=Ajellomyces capsulatus TaxID=5037 RepID=A0A8H7ZAG2_AJECA|nr:hypothetical protein I7I52_02371 [Histoplasma capsulatum]QSS69736.1 hypothetical protein I7I50_11132 [Histoplasma capsulatum G186AR]
MPLMICAQLIVPCVGNLLTWIENVKKRRASNACKVLIVKWEACAILLPPHFLRLLNYVTWAMVILFGNTFIHWY